MKTVLMATVEFAPFVKAGGLGDVAGALPFELKKAGVDVRVIMPLYSFLPAKITESMRFVKETIVTLGWRKQYCGIYAINYNGLPMYFIDSKFYFGGDKLYYEFDTDIERFSFFCAAVLNALPHIDFVPDILHCHDWHTSMIPVLYHAHFKKLSFYSSIKMMLTIHNLKYQGLCYKYKLYDILGIDDENHVSRCLSYGFDAANCLKGGLSLVEKITTVSDTYANEIREPYFGEGLDWLLKWRGKDVAGIVNGIDTHLYDPARDGAIAEKYTAGNAIQAKKRNKAALQKELGLEENPNRPIIAVVSRLFEQKGLDLIVHVFEEIMNIKTLKRTADEGGADITADADIAADATVDAIETVKPGASDDAVKPGAAGDTVDAADASAAIGTESAETDVDGNAAATGVAAAAKVESSSAAETSAADMGYYPEKPQFVVLGTGEGKYEKFFRDKEYRYPGSAASCIMFDEALARRIYAGADFFLMPSLFEPCGISQMIAMRYGTIPIVRETGGLRDTVHSYNINTGEGNGYGFKNINAHDMLYTIERAVDIYFNEKETHAKIVKSAMAGDYSWDKSVKRYIGLYECM